MSTSQRSIGHRPSLGSFLRSSRLRHAGHCAICSAWVSLVSRSSKNTHSCLPPTNQSSPQICASPGTDSAARPSAYPLSGFAPHIVPYRTIRVGYYCRGTKHLSNKRPEPLESRIPAPQRESLVLYVTNSHTRSWFCRSIYSYSDPPKIAD